MRRPPPIARARRTLALAAIAAAAVALGCAGEKREPSVEPVVEVAPEPARPSDVARAPARREAGVEPARPAPTPPPPPAPTADTPARTPEGAEEVQQIAPAFGEGLELAWWITADPDGKLAETLTPFASGPRALPVDVDARWRAAGFRVLAIEEREVRDVLESLPPIGGVQRDWIGLKSRWAEAFRPPPEARLDARPIIGLSEEVRPSRLRLLARSWPAPSDDGPVLRVDLAAQHHLPKNVFQRITLDNPGLPRAQDEGPVFDDVAAELALREGRVLLIVGEQPEVAWGEPAVRQDHPAGAIPADRFDPEVADGERARAAADWQEAQGGGFGPPVARPQSLGEAMLMAETSALYPAPTRTIILLIPRVGEEYSLLP